MDLTLTRVTYQPERVANRRALMSECRACGHDAPHDSPGYDGCVADVMHEDEEGDGIPYFLQCCCDGTSGHVVKVAWVRKKPEVDR
jgi:hypothetical protein